MNAVKHMDVRELPFEISFGGAKKSESCCRNE